jgi:hypothetical protein
MVGALGHLQRLQTRFDDGDNTGAAACWVLLILLLLLLLTVVVVVVAAAALALTQYHERVLLQHCLAGLP